MRKLISVVVLAMSFVFLAGCMDREPTTSQKQEHKRDSLMDKANYQVPIPTISNFVARKSVAEYMRRMDEPNKTFYIYVLADTGNIIGYYVASSQPVNICTFMSPTDKVERHTTSGGGNVKRAAPANDGLYYGAGGCNVDYFFDANSGALIQLRDLKMVITDQPLDIEAEAITVK